ncbi:amidohydrolase family protein [Aggregicoccus sp. 17bor-14]|uniref:amidohydrolase family protein n=1 Tax=Myxococcaceae TaxID=31 RepID=UPI00129C5B30|nr:MULTISPECIES: amidohydrolase family protein [Myxococcaceae]MBF5046284.1 PD40 domain-containing protein [Simulacricoccus sp. 17bor-14]MRI92006.1 amidohydrolase family protein [Aggregicoccus sp. 17bor-14]
MLCVALPSARAQTQQPPPEPPPIKEPQENDTARKKEEAHEKAAQQNAADGGTAKGLDVQLPEGAGKKEAAWDVNNPGGPGHDVPLDVREGTWLSVDVSPKGDELVFDLLGDIYVLPIGGGEARALTSGVAWDMQPRYSPDGQSIAFTSDRGGGDNLWIMRRDGSSPFAVTNEKLRLLNSPAWSPDGQYLLGRKHFTARRSLGAGEIWMYHRSGGEGVQLTERPNEQKDVGEPAFSPDGRYVYYSQDITPGRVFEYNKDPNTEIYVIQRLDRDTGETTQFVGGPGGAIRPTPSPDGKSLAFIRRVRGKSVLYLADVASGAERPLYDGLERDMQETWAIHGVYPQIAWTPDSKSLVFWARGHLHRLDVASKQVKDIPFHVKAVRHVTEALRFPQAVAPEQFPVRMLRWVQVSPTGDRVVYQALGHLYVKQLPNGTPHRLTKQTDHFELYPSFSRDGRNIVFTTWDDDKLGSVRVVSASGGAERTVTPHPGHYLEPAFSPDGRSIVYRSSGDGYLRSGLWSRDPGLYVIPAQGGAQPRLLTKDGQAPHFGKGSERVYFLTVEEGEKEDKRALKSIALDGSEERTHLTSGEATEVRVSPDERWVAFQQNFNAFLMPFVRGARSAVASADGKALPVARVTRDAGSYLHWSGDSQRLHWALGPELYTRELKDAFRFMQGAPEKLPPAPEHGQNISFTQRADAPEGTLAFVGGRVITMKGDQVLEDGTVVVRGNRIVAVGPRGQVQVPAGARVVDVKGKTLMPGIVDVHWHGPMGSDGITPEQGWPLYAALAFGVTTIHDPSNDTGEVFSAAELQRAGSIVGPHIFSTGTVLYGASGAFRAPVETLEDARSHLRRMKAVGAFSVKSYNQPRRDQRQKILQAARELQMMVVPEGGSLFEHNMTMVVDGHTGVEHSLPVERVYEDALQLWSGTKVGYTPTLIVAYGGNWGENYWYQTTHVWEDQRLLTFVPRRVVDARSRRPTQVPDEELNHFNEARVARAFNDRGVSVQLGAHGQREGMGAHWELQMFGQGGMKPLQALRAATLEGAQYLGLDRDVGSLEVGKLADLLVLDQNPLEALKNTQSIRYTLANGRLYDAHTMNELAPRQRARGPFWFETQDGNEGWSAPARVSDGHGACHD